MPYKNSVSTVYGEIEKSHTKTVNLKHQVQMEKTELSDWSHSVWGIQDYFEHIIKKLQTMADDCPIRIHVNKTENTITFKIKTGHYIEFLTSETIKLRGSTENKATKYKNWEINLI